MTWKDAILIAMQQLGNTNIHENKVIQKYIVENELIPLNNTVESTISKNLEILESERKVEKIQHGQWKLK